MPRRALLIGIDSYQNFTGLGGAVADAQAMKRLLERNDDKSVNYHCRLIVNPDGRQVTKERLRQLWRELFDNTDDEVLFYFAGHGAPGLADGYICTCDGTRGDPGLPMSELLTIANRSRAREVLLILDCCHAGHLGDPPNLGAWGAENQAQLREGVTILAATRQSQEAMESSLSGRFTALVLAALSGGAADVRGFVSAPALYAYVEQALGPWDQRPLFKSYTSCLSPIRRCRPRVPDERLYRLEEIFPEPSSSLQMQPSYERTSPSAIPEHVEMFDLLKQYRNAGLIRTVDHDDLFFAAMHGGRVELTALGKGYWRLVAEGWI
ncbi:caspase domain-containing protein [Sorangium cellulosum]|uniref:caspase family protein n=1 Tax=Sorangium cellulosum TaxID=56 RepID=UPI003D9AA4B2